MTAALSRDEPGLELEPLVAQAVAGNARALGDLLGEIRRMALRYCRGRLGRQETGLGSAEDVAQDVCAAVLNALPTYQLKGLSFRAFVFGIASHKVTDTYRAIGRNRTEPVGELPDVAVVRDGPEQHALDNELAEMLGQLLDEISPRQRDVLLARVVMGLSAEETAACVGSTPGAVRVTQHRALVRLRELTARRP
jgi:RNA polymerase sigma-70 factor, ECF subfamily